MHAQALPQTRVRDLLVPVGLLLGLSVVMLWQLGMADFRPAPNLSGPETVSVLAHSFQYRMPGDFQMNGHPINGLWIEAAGADIEVMRYQVSLADYRQCVAEAACEAPEPIIRPLRDDVPVTGVSYDDAVAYAAWLSQRTGAHWRLPSVEEWIFVAAERAVDHAVVVQTDPRNPAERWIAAYEQESRRAIESEATPQALGFFGENTLGLADIGGNVWEWTATCANRTTLAADGNIAGVVESCGVHYLEGRHLTPMSVFVRDARGGGCSVGAPPDNLGFRLVREARPLFGLPFSL